MNVMMMPRQVGKKQASTRIEGTDGRNTQAALTLTSRRIYSTHFDLFSSPRYSEDSNSRPTGPDKPKSEVYEPVSNFFFFVCKSREGRRRCRKVGEDEDGTSTVEQTDSSIER
jgi:hypothetical protein